MIGFRNHRDSFVLKKSPEKNSLLRRDLLRKPVAPIVRSADVTLESQDAKAMRPDVVIHRKRKTRHQISPHPSLDHAPEHPESTQRRAPPHQESLCQARKPTARKTERIRSVLPRDRGDKSGAADGTPRSPHHLFVGATLHHTGCKLLNTPNGLRQSLRILCRCQTRIDTLPESLGEGHSFGNRQCHGFGRELLDGHGKNLSFQETSINKRGERGLGQKRLYQTA